jgi:hypothetical protein
MRVIDKITDQVVEVADITNHGEVFHLISAEGVIYRRFRDEVDVNSQEVAEQVITHLRNANLTLNELVKADDIFAAEVQQDISNMMDSMRDRYFGKEEE